MMSKPRLILISGTDGRLVDFQRYGFFNRQKRLVAEYAKHFDIEYYTSDIQDFTQDITVTHRCLPLKIDIYGARHLLFWLYLVWKAPSMKAPIRMFGVAIPTLPLIKRLSGQKLIVGFQWDYASVTKANYGGLKRWLADTLQAIGLSSADLVICTTERLRRIVEEKYKKPAEVISNFVDTELFQRKTKKENFVLYAGRLHWAKGIEYLIRAFGRLNEQVHGTHLLICGEGDHGPALRQLVVNEGIADVDFLGVVPQDRLAELMARAKAFVFPTVNYEGNPKALIEAMACGTACVATNVPGNRDIITHNVNGLLVPPKDPDPLHRALSLLFVDEKLRAELGRNAHLFAVDNYSVERTVSREVQFIDNWIQRNRLSTGLGDISSLPPSL